MGQWGPIAASQCSLLAQKSAKYFPVFSHKFFTRAEQHLISLFFILRSAEQCLIPVIFFLWRRDGWCDKSLFLLTNRKTQKAAGL